MNAAELRIGNYVTIDNPGSWPDLQNEPMIVYGIENWMSGQEKSIWAKSDGKIKLKANYETYGQFSQFIKPIPLNEEWLLKFGFKIKYLTIEKKVNSDFAMTLIPPHEVNKCYHFMPSAHIKWGVDIQFVHQLQNLYFALSGQELTIK